jgi:radical SAM protein with 4Fe4S-binding SPASM domain
VLVKVFGNYPLIDAEELSMLVSGFVKGDYLYGTNEHVHGVISGLGAEVFTRKLLEETFRENGTRLHKKIGTRNFIDTVDQGRQFFPSCDKKYNRPNYRATYEVPADKLIIDEILNKIPEPDHRNIAEFIDRNPVLAEYAHQNISSPSEVGVEKLFHFPEKIKALNSTSCGRDFALDRSYPVSVELALTSRCNLACKWCSDNELRNNSPGDMSTDVLSSLFRDLATNGCRGIVIEGGGEATLHPDFLPIIESARGLGLKLGLITNGVKVDYLEKSEYFEWIRVSLDATRAEQFKTWKGRDCFDEVMANIEKLGVASAVHGGVLGVGYVLTRHNLEGLEELIIKLRRLNVDYIQVRPVIDHPEMLPDNLDLDFLQKYSTPSFKVNVSGLRENVVTGNFNLPCRAHSLSTVIHSDGSVFICGRLNKYDWLKPMGNLNKETFNGIWNGSERARQAEQLKEPDFCRKWCPECRLTKFNVTFDNIGRMKTVNFI